MDETNLEADGVDRREGRGRLSSIDMLPEEAEEDIAWANAELSARQMPQTEILRLFNARLADKGIGSISKGAFSRWSVRKAIVTRKHEAVREMTARVLGKLSPADRNDSTIALTELIKHQIGELVLGAEAPDPGMLGFACLSLQRLGLTAARASADTRVERKARKAEKDDRKKTSDEKAKADREQAATEAATIGTEAGLSAETIAAIRKGVLGIGQ